MDTYVIKYGMDLITPLAPTHVCIIFATRCHSDDFIGRILERMRIDRSFPQFELQNFLHEVNFILKSIYFLRDFLNNCMQQFSSFGIYGSSASLQCDPVTLSGNLLDTSRIVFC